MPWVNIEGKPPAMACKRPDVDLKEAVLAMTVGHGCHGNIHVLNQSGSLIAWGGENSC